MGSAVVFIQMIKLFLYMCVGFVLYKIHMIDDHTRGQLTRFVLYVTNPALIIYSFIENVGNVSSKTLLIAFAVAAVMYTVLPLVGILLNLILRIKKNERGMYAFMTVFSNVGFMGFPVVESMYGSEGLFYTAIFTCMFNIYVFTLGVFLMNYGVEEDKVKNGFNAKKLINPGVICCVVAILIYVTKVPVPDVIKDVIGGVGGLTSVLAMILVGAGLAMIDIKKLFADVKVYIYTIIRQFALPLLAWLLIDRVIENRMLAIVTFIMLAMPVGNNSLLFATEYGRDEDVATRAIFITTVVSVISIPVTLSIILR